jgi:lipopolysaccharide transport system permease protein
MDKPKWNISITPKQNPFKLNLGEVLEYKDLVYLFVKRDFVAVYKQTILGPFWHLIQPMLTAFTLYIVFTRIAHMAIPGGVSPLIYYMSAVIIWNYFASCLNKSANIFLQNASIFGKVYFPRITVPLSFLFSNAISFSFQLFFFFVIAGITYFKGYTLHIQPTFALIPFILFILGLQGMAAGMIISAMTTKYRDLTYLVSFGVQLLMYLSPVIYTIQSLSPEIRRYMMFNPMAPFIELFRYSLTRVGYVDFRFVGISIAITIVLLLSALVIFNKTEKDFIDTI